MMNREMRDGGHSKSHGRPRRLFLFHTLSFILHPSSFVSQRLHRIVQSPGAASRLALPPSLDMVRCMKSDEIRKLLHAQPFRPFIVHVADGGRLLVKHEDYVALAPSGREMLVYRHDKADDYQVVDIMLVTRLEIAARNGAKKPLR